MKKNCTLLIASIAIGIIGLSSCSKVQERSIGMPDQDPAKISLLPNTGKSTYATVNTINALQNASNGFKVWATGNGNTSGWHDGMDGTLSYKFSSAAWQWIGGKAPEWPLDVGSYPMNFYSYFAGNTTVTEHITAPTPGNPNGSVAFDFVADAERSKQVDLLSVHSIVSEKPVSGAAPLNFQHILSKINFSVVAGNGKTVYILNIAIKNANNSGTYNVTTQAWDTVSGSTAFNYVTENNVTKSEVGFTGTDLNESTAVPVYAGQAADLNNMMLIPQVHNLYTPAKGVLPTADQAYIEVTYRVVDSSTGADLIGKTDNGSGSPLYVTTAFPLGGVAAPAWEPAKSYTYALYLATTNSSGGIVTNPDYVDNTGGDSGVTVVDHDNKPITPGTPITSGEIRFVVSVADWGTTTDITISK